MYKNDLVSHSTVVAGLLISAGLSACVSSHIVVGTVRPPIPPAQVRIYIEPPANYEEVAVLDTSSKNSLVFTAQGKTDLVIERLKEEAANLGANGVLLRSVGNQAVGTIAASTAGLRLSGRSASLFGLAGATTLYVKQGDGLAIYVDPAHAGDPPQKVSLAAKRSHDLGISMKTATAGGALVTSVARDSLADNSGIVAGDVLVSLGDTVINTPDDLQTAIAAVRVDERVTVKLLRKAAPEWVSIQF